jgi:hypothetical protein
MHIVNKYLFMMITDGLVIACNDTYWAVPCPIYTLYVSLKVVDEAIDMFSNTYICIYIYVKKIQTHSHIYIYDNRWSCYSV